MSLVLPVYDEEAVLDASIPQLLRTLGAWDLELLVVDDGSRDSSAAIVRRWAQRDGRVHLLQLIGNRGKGAAVRAGLARARGDSILVTDADLSADPACAWKLVKALETGADVVFGSRRTQGARLEQRQPRLREELGRGFTALTNRMFGLGLTDLTCGFKALNQAAARALVSCTRVEGWAFDVEWAVCARAQGFRLEEVPVRWSHQPDSKVRVARAVFSSLLELKQIWRAARRGQYSDREWRTGSLRDHHSVHTEDPRRNERARSLEEFPLPPENGGVTIPSPIPPLHHV